MSRPTAEFAAERGCPLAQSSALVAQPARITVGMFTSRTDEWATPQALYDSLSLEFGGFETDVAANAENHKAPVWFGPGSPYPDGLTQTWGGRCWMNPPYGREIGKWVKKASEAAALVVCLLPARTDTAYWHDHVIPNAKEIRFLRGRVKFSGKGPAPFPSAVVVFDGRVQ